MTAIVNTVSKTLILSTYAVLMLVGCAGNKPKSDQVFLMPAPGIYEQGDIDPFVDNDTIAIGGVPDILYATDRRPATGDDKKYAFFTHERGHALHVGTGATQLGVDEGITWDEARRISLLKNRTDNYPIEVTGIDDFGVLEQTVRPFDDINERTPLPGERFSAAIQERLARSATKDVFIYVHGYKVNFESPVLVAAELWHFLGYRGAFIAYSWPTKASVFAYLADLDSALNSARSLRKLILHIAETTDVERIHIVGYSAGTRLVSRTLADLGMYTAFMGDDELKEALKLGNVILTGSDVDPNIVGGYLADGALRGLDSLTIYQSQADGALNWSRRVFGRSRTGQVVDDVNPAAVKYLSDNPKLRVIDVTEAEGGTDSGGHNYFRSSPWVSSDVLMTLMFDLTPEQRGLVRNDEAPTWRFPSDYVERLRQALGSADPELAASIDTAPN